MRNLASRVRKSIPALCLGVLTAFFADVTGVAGQTSDRAETVKKKIVLGRVSNDPRKTYPRLEKMAGYLAGRLRSHGIVHSGVVITQNNREMIRLLKEGKVDFLSETVMSSLLMQEAAGAEIMLREWKRQKGWYWSAFIARRESGIEKLADLRGKRIAFEDRGSTTGFLLPLAILRRRGMELVELSSHDQPVPPGKVGYLFAYRELDITAWVERMKVHAGAYSNTDWLGIGRSPRAIRKNLKVIYKSRPVVRSLFLARGDLPKPLKAAVKAILLSIHENEAGRRILGEYYDVGKYDEIKGEVEESLAECRRLFSFVRNHIL